MISLRNFACFSKGKNFDKNFWHNSCQVVIELAGREFSQLFAASHSENGNKMRRMASSVTLLYLNVSHNSTKLEMWSLGFSVGVPPN